MENLEVVVIGYGILNVLSLIIAIAFFLSNREERAYKLNVYYWVAMVIIFLSQGILLNSQDEIAFAFLTTTSMGYIFAHFNATLFNIEMPIRRYRQVLVVGIILSIGGIFMTESFMMSTIPTAFATAAVCFHTVYRTIKLSSSITHAGWIYLSGVVLMASHFLDFPFLRLNEELPMSGFYVAFVLGVFMSIIMPYYISERTLKKYASKLEREVANRTKDLSEANQKLEVAVQDNKNLTRILCHDIGNQTLILDYSHFRLRSLLKDDMQPEALENLKKGQLTRAELVLEQQKELLTTVRSMLALDSGKVDIKLQLINLLDTFLILEDIIDDQLKAKELSISMKCAPNLNVYSEASLFLNSVLKNLATNAIKFSHPGGHITVRAFRLPNQKVRIAFRDNGIGIPADILEHIFDGNTRTSRVGTGGEKGTGFGMPLLRVVLDKTNGEVMVRSRTQEESELESYTTFFIDLTTPESVALENTPTTEMVGA